MKRYGTKYGGYVYPEPLNLSSQSILYSFGIGEDVSHDVQLAAATGATVHLFDPTPRAIEHMQIVHNTLEGSNPPTSKRFGGGDPAYWSYIQGTSINSEQLKLYPFGIYTKNDELPFYLPKNPEYVSGSLVPEGRSSTSILKVPVKDILSITNDLGHSNGPDLLKLDIEGVECEVLEQIVHETHFRPTYIAVDFDTARTGPRGVQKVQATLQILKSAGYSILHSDDWDITLMYSAKSS